MNFQLDAKAVARTDKSSISTSGYYEGVITQCYLKSSGQSNAVALAFSFKSEDDATVNFDIWVQGKDGSFTFGYDIFQAGLACLKLRAVLAKIGKVKVWENGEEIEADRSIYPELCDKKIGVILQKEEYLNAKGDVGYKMNLKHFINAETKQTGSEVIAQTPSVKFEKLKDKYADILLPKQITQIDIRHPEIDIKDDEIPF